MTHVSTKMKRKHEVAIYENKRAWGKHKGKGCTIATIVFLTEFAHRHHSILTSQYAVIPMILVFVPQFANSCSALDHLIPCSFLILPNSRVRVSNISSLF